MARKMIDISVAIENDITVDPPGMDMKINYMNHKQTVGQLLPFFPGLEQEELPGGEAWAIEQVSLFTHNGTHLDAPYHFHSTMNNGERAITIDEVPLEWCFNRGVKLDFRHFEDGYVVTAQDIKDELKRIDHELQPLDIVVVNTSAAEAYGKANYLAKGCGIGREATLYLLEQGVRITGTDAWSWDAPFVFTAQKYAESKDAGIIWEGHRASMEIGYCHLEKLSNLESLPDSGFMISCFPVKIKGASAAWARAVAILQD